MLKVRKLNVQDILVTFNLLACNLNLAYSGKLDTAVWGGFRLLD